MKKEQSDTEGWVALGPDEFSVRGLPIGNLDIPEFPGVDVWFMDLDRLSSPLRSALGDGNGSRESAPLAELASAQLRFTRRFYLRSLLGSYLDVPGKDVKLVLGHRGKPVLDAGRHGQGLHFSMAKSESCLLVGISGNSEVGVDLEIRDRRPRRVEELARRFFSREEAEAIVALPAGERALAFMKTWACKEAVVKSSGQGIANRFCRFSVELPESGPPRVKTDQDYCAADWQLALLLPEKQFLAAVAARQQSMGLRAFVLEADSN